MDALVTAGAWLAAAALCWQAALGGGLPREVTASSVASYAGGGSRVRVLVFEGARRVSARPSGPAELVDGETGEKLGLMGAGALLTFRPQGGRVRVASGRFRASAAELLLRPRTRAQTTVSAEGRRGRFFGALSFRAAGGRLRVVESADLEDYVAGVVDAELPDSFPLEAMKAQAVAARTYALFHLGDHARQGADLCSRVHCQVYRGAPGADSQAWRAARETAGQVLVWNGLLVDAMYHSACGGHTAPAWEVRRDKILPYLRGVSDRAPGAEGAPYCAAGLGLGWTKRLSWREADRLVFSNLGTVLGRPGLKPGRLKALRVAARGRDGRVIWLEVVTARARYRVRGDGIRWLFGTGLAGPRGLRSTDFRLTVQRDAAGRPRGVVFTGKGYGHGIGLCQWGARGRALAGQTAAEILRAYYPGTDVVDLRRLRSPQQVNDDGRAFAICAQTHP